MNPLKDLVLQLTPSENKTLAEGVARLRRSYGVSTPTEVILKAVAEAAKHIDTDRKDS